MIEHYDDEYENEVFNEYEYDEESDYEEYLMSESYEADVRSEQWDWLKRETD